MVINDGKNEKIILQWADNTGALGETTISRKFDTLDHWTAKSTRDIDKKEIVNLFEQFALGIDMTR